MADYRVIVIGPDGNYIEAKAPDRVIIDNLVSDSTVFPAGDPTGFQSVGETDLTWDHSTATLTISPTGPSFSFYVGGTKFTKTAPESITISMPGHAYYSFAYDSNGDLINCTTPFIYDGNFCPIAVVTYDTTGGTRSVMADHRGQYENTLMARKLGTVRENIQANHGFDIADYTLNVDDDNSVQFSLASGQFTLLDIVHNVADIDPPSAPYEQPLSKPAQLPIVYRLGTDWTWDAPNTFAYKLGPGSGRTAYNLNTAGVWSVAEPPSPSYVAYWIVLTNNTQNPIISVMGQSYYPTLVEAKEGHTFGSLYLWERFPATCFKVLYRLILRTETGYGGNRKCRIADVADYRGIPNSEHFPLHSDKQALPVDHSALKGISNQGSHPAAAVATDTTKFRVLLSSADDDVQKALETLDLHHHHAEYVANEYISLFGRSIYLVEASFWGLQGCNYFRNKHMGTWDVLYKNCYWQVKPDTSATWTSPPQRFANTGDFFTWLEMSVPTDPSEVYTTNAQIRAFEIVDDRDSFPNRLVHRNSMLASMMGRRMWLRKHATGTTKLYGVDGGFYTWYSAWFNTLGMRLVNYYTTVVPPTNNDDVVWYSRGSRTQWNWPQPTAAVTEDPSHAVAVNPNYRGAAWDMTTSAWVTPAPPGYYNIREPFYLAEWNRGRSLSFESPINSNDRNMALQSVCCLVYPLEFPDPVSGHTFLAFLMVPHGCDNFSTEYVNPATHEVVMAKHYAHGYNKNYLLPYPYNWTPSTFESGWGLFNSSGAYSQSLVFYPKTTPGGAHFTADPNSIPREIFIAKRDLATGIRSPWRSVLKIRKRLPHSTYRVDPSPRWQRI